MIENIYLFVNKSVLYENLTIFVVLKKLKQLS